MSNANAPSSGTPVPPAPPPAKEVRELRIYGHSTLFYWWPMWVISFLFGMYTYFGDGRTAVLDKHAIYEKSDDVAKQVIKLDGKGSKQLVLSDQYEERDGKNYFFERMHANKGMGVMFVVSLLLVIFITNVPLRGVTSAVFIAAVIAITLFFALMDWWSPILNFFGRLSIHMNAGFYFFFGALLFIVWVLVTYVFDRMNYWRVTPGQITHEYVFGGGQTSFDTEGIAFKKLRDDLFRHWVLGMGSGDLMMFPLQQGTAARDEMAIHNVLFIGSKMDKIQRLIATRVDETAKS